jgi:hypothetical protein
MLHRWMGFSIYLATEKRGEEVLDRPMTYYLTRQKRDLILTSLRLSEYLGILFNWNLNRVLYQEDRGGYSVPQAKNIVLETVYSIGYRVDTLLKILLFEVNRSFKNIKEEDHDPGAILCAL